jgi:hypothetical protein
MCPLGQKFEKKYKHSYHGKTSGIPIKTYVTCATDNAMIKNIFEKYIQSIAEMSMMNSGFVG